MVALRKGLDATFGNNLLKGSKVRATNNRGGRFNARNLIDNDPATYYAGRDGNNTGEVVFTLPRPATFDCLMAAEVIDLGHRTTGWAVDWSTDGKTWNTIPEASALQSIGHKWIARFKPVTAKYVRLRITDGVACPALHTFGVYKIDDSLK